MSLPKRPLGSSGLQITTVGLGAWAIGGGDWAFGWGPQNDEESIATMREAVEAGINWIDTAGVYGLGHSEEIVGRFLRQMPEDDRPLVFTKGGPYWEWNPKDPAFRREDPPSDLRPEIIRRQVDESLRRLGVERIDLYQFHWPDERGTPIEDSWSEMERQIQAGKVRFGGVSNFDTRLLARCEQIRHVDSLQQEFSLLARETADAELPWLRAHGTGMLCYSPMGSGQLTDHFTKERVAGLPESDFRSRSSRFKEPRLSRNLALRDRLLPVAQRHGTTIAAVAVAWVLAWPGVSGAIVGARRPGQIAGWIDAAGLELGNDDLDEIAAAIGATGAGEGPLRP